jgi:hypothetical protein
VTDRPEPGERGDELLAQILTWEGPATKRARKRLLFEALHGRPPRARDDRGQYARPAPGSLDGGARTPPPLPPESHDTWLARALGSRTADRGARF